MTTPRADDAAPTPAIPGRYWIWLTGTGLTLLGVQTLSFAMAWAASGFGGVSAGLLLTAITLPRVLLLLFGGAVADQRGPWRLMMITAALSAVVSAAFAVSSAAGVRNFLLLLVTGVVIGTIDAFHLPASGSVPRRMVPLHQLPRAMSARQIVAQASAVLGAPLGAVIVASAGIAVAALLNSLAFAVMVALLRVIAPHTGRSTAAHPAASGTPTLFARAMEGLHYSVRDPLLRPALLVVVSAAAFLLPVVVPLVPLLARDQGWDPLYAGLVAGAAGAGTAVVAVLVMVTGGLNCPGLAAAAGLGIAGLGTLGLVLAPPVVPALVAAAATIGVGTGAFATHLGPLVLGNTPESHLSRVQAVVMLAQSLPLLVTNLALGAMAEALGADLALALCAAAQLATAATACLSTTLRSARRST